MSLPSPDLSTPSPLHLQPCPDLASHAKSSALLPEVRREIHKQIPHPYTLERGQGKAGLRRWLGGEPSVTSTSIARLSDGKARVGLSLHCEAKATAENVERVLFLPEEYSG